MWRSSLRKSFLFERAAAHNMAWWVNQQLGCWQYPAIKATIKFRVTLQWIWQVVLTLGREQGRPVWSICLRVGSSKKIWWKGWWLSREERKHGGIYWLPTWLKTAALERNTSVYPCGHFLLLYWHGRRWIISRIQGLTSPVWVLGSKEQNNVVAVHQKLAKHCEY